MRLIKQLRTLSWGTPVQIISGEESVFSGTAKEAFSADELREYLDLSIKTVKLNKAVNSVLQIIIEPMEGKGNESKG